MKPRTYPGYIPRNQIQAAIRERTGQLVSKQRIGRWINTGELRMLKVPSGCGYRWFTKDIWINDLVEKYTYEEPPAQTGGLRMPCVDNKPPFYFPRNRGGNP